MSRTHNLCGAGLSGWSGLWGRGREERDKRDWRETRDAGLVHLVGLSIWSVSIFCSSHQMNQINKNNQRNQNNQLNQPIAAGGISHHPAGEKIDRQMEMIHPLSVDSQFPSTGSEVGLFAGCGLGFAAVGFGGAAGVVTVGLGAGSV